MSYALAGFICHRLLTTAAIIGNYHLTLSGYWGKVCARTSAGAEMPDGDVITRSPVRLWKRPHDLLCSGADGETVADGICHSLLGSLRDKGGLPGAQDLAALVDSLIVGNTTLPEALEEVHEVEWRHGFHIHTRVAAEAVRRLLVEIGQGKGPNCEPLRAVVVEFCSQLIRYQLLGRIGPDQKGFRYTEYDGYLEWEQKVLGPVQSRVEALVSGLVRDPSGRSLPRRSQVPAPARPETATILQTNLLEIG